MSNTEGVLSKLSETALTIMLTLTVFFLFPGQSDSQVSGEVKVDLFGVFSPAVNVSYEAGLNPNWSLQFRAGHEWSKISWIDQTFAPGTVVVEENSFNINYLHIYLMGRYYPKPKYGQDQFFIGMFSHQEFETFKDLGYENAYLVRFGSRPSTRKWIRNAIGVSIGYKWNVSRRLTLEPVTVLDLDMRELLKNREKYWESPTFLNLGYRLSPIEKQKRGN